MIDKKVIKIYLDNCCYNRPFDEQTQDLIRLETEAKLIIHNRIKHGSYSLVWSFILDSENDENPAEDHREAIRSWKFIADENCSASEEILLSAKKFGSVTKYMGEF
jgi:S-adenosylmethionine synthetase